MFSLNKLYSQINRSLNESWRFSKDSTITNINQFVTHLNKTTLVDIPHTWNDKDVIDEKEGFYRGAGWYAKTIKVPSTYKNKQVFLYFEGVSTVAKIYINKQLRATHIGGYTRFVVPVSDFINFSNADNFSTFDVVIKADNSYHTDVPPLSADFTFFGGVYRDVHLIVKEKVHFNLEDYATNGVYISTPNVSKDEGKIHFKTKIKNDKTTSEKVILLTKIYDSKNKLVQEISKKIKLKKNDVTESEYDESIKNPLLWSPDKPNLYRVVCEIYDTKTKDKIDESVNPLGFRWYKFDYEKGFFLNGKHLKLIGTNRHQDFKEIGNALLDYIHIDDIKRIKEMGSNFLRISHYPQDEAILEMCDKLGIITTVETPNVNAISQTEAFAQNSINAQVEMIRQNYNHPSIIIWAYMNEILLRPPFARNGEDYKSYIKDVAKLANRIEEVTRKEDAFRYTMIPNHGNLKQYQEAGLTEIPMIVGWNIYNGWYGGAFTTLDDKMLDIHQHIKKPMIIAEYGAGVDPRLHTLEPLRFDFSQEYGTQQHQYYLDFIKKQDYIAGANVWNYADFSSESRVDVVQSVNNKGLVSLDRTPKDAYFLYQANLLEEPFIAIGTKTWNKRSHIEDSHGSGVSTMPVQIFSNQKEIELMHNGKSLGIKTVENAIAVFQVPFINGVNKLKAQNTAENFQEDFSLVSVNVLPISLKDFPSSGLSINLGDKRFFYDDKINQPWAISREYSKGSWGHVGGTPYVKVMQSMQQPYGAKQTIKGTINHPLYQTQLIGIEQYRFDVNPGVYQVILHFAELEGKEVKPLAYDLSEGNTNKTKLANRSFSVFINDKEVLQELDILNQYGEYRAVKIKSEISIDEGKSLIIDFKKKIGEAILNAIEIYKKL
jgi:beta-galactosidase